MRHSRNTKKGLKKRRKISPKITTISRTLQTTATKGNDFRRGKADLLKVQISVKVRRPKGRKISADVLRGAVMAKLNSPTFKNPPGFKIRMVWWQNPTRNPDKINPRDGNPLNARRNYGSQFERWQTLARALRRTHMDFKPLGKGQRL